MNIGAIFSEVASIYETLSVDEAELAAGTPVTIPMEPQVGSIDGKPIYLNAVLSTTKNAALESPVIPSAKTA
jgi:hypothetical protein